MRFVLQVVGVLALWALSTTSIACGLAGAYYLWAVSYRADGSDKTTAIVNYDLGSMVVGPFILMPAYALGVPLAYLLVGVIKRLVRLAVTAPRPE